MINVIRVVGSCDDTIVPIILYYADAKKSGSKIQTASSQMVATFKKITANIEASWLKRMGKYKNVDAGAALADLRAAIKSYK